MIKALFHRHIHYEAPNFAHLKNIWRMLKEFRTDRFKEDKLYSPPRIEHYEVVTVFQTILPKL